MHDNVLDTTGVIAGYSSEKPFDIRGDIRGDFRGDFHGDFHGDLRGNFRYRTLFHGLSRYRMNRKFNQGKILIVVCNQYKFKKYCCSIPC